MLHIFTAAERRVVLAHERAHLDHQHHRYRRITALAAAANPLLRRLRDDVAYTCERWADEDAVTTTGTDRRLTARALTRAAQAAVGRTAATSAAAFERLNVADRVAALQANPPRIRPSLLLGCALLTIAAAIADGDATMSFARFFASMIPAVRDIARTTGM
jgi:beta-lactamase regulating signal transducer with metallopeptidase domain